MHMWWSPRIVEAAGGLLPAPVLQHSDLPRGRFPRVFGDKFGEEFGDKFCDEFSESPNLVMN